MRPEVQCPGCTAWVPPSGFYKQASGRFFKVCRACSYGAQRKRHTLRKGAGTFPPLQTRFWSKVARGSADACWPFHGVRDRKGYGRFHMKSQGACLAHRVAWELVNGPAPKDRCVMHECDNPPCCNPAHLRLGTDADNKADMLAKGRLRDTHTSIPVDEARSIRIVALLGVRPVENAALHRTSCYRVTKLLGASCG